MRNIICKLFVCLLICLSSALHAQEDVQKKLQTQMIMVEDGQTIDIEEGTFQLTRGLSIESKNDLIIQGKGMDKTILSFKGQVDGAEGLRVSNGKNIIIRDLTIQDAKGDCIKTMNIDGITFKNVKVEWTGKPDKNNGAYGLYPVSCQNVLIDACVATGASDAGIYVGQSKNIIVRNSKAYLNVAGIEIENSLFADVHNNEAYNNTGGILVFDLPDLVQKKGGNVRVFNNVLRENNYENFAPKGNIVASVPPGTGIMILATNQVEIFNNKISNNITANTSIISYFMTENPIKDSLYYPFPTGINIHDNVYQREAVRPTMKGRIGKLYRFKLKFGTDVPDIVYDGIIDPATRNTDGSIKPEFKICIRNNQNATFANLDAENDFKNVSRDLKPYDCTLSNIEAPKLSNAGTE
ncbi:MAG: parallel beta-helix domain-containing protein [Microscillaceae bacterium]|nr:parallel beta-helix domain-containing protein [Microscillaceae bacterium]